jgi:hypothetical protein
VALAAQVGWVVPFPLVLEERLEVLVSLAQPVEVRVVADPLRRALHLALGIADRELQAVNHFPDQGNQLGLRDVFQELDLPVLGAADAVMTFRIAAHLPGVQS